MANNIPAELYNQFFEIAERGDETAARKFLIDNLKQFPEQAQDEIIMAFFEEALAKKNNEDSLILEFQKQGIATANTLERAKEKLASRLKMAEIKESL